MTYYFDMSKSPYRQDREELKALLQQYENLKAGLPNSFIEEDGFERIVEYFEEKEQFTVVLEVCEYAISQYPYSASLLFVKANALIVLRKYDQALEALEQAELLDSNDTTLYILKTEFR